MIIKQVPHIYVTVCAKYIVCNGIKNQPNVNRICSLELQVHREPFHECELPGFITLSVSRQICLQRMAERVIKRVSKLDKTAALFKIRLRFKRNRNPGTGCQLKGAYGSQDGREVRF